MPAAQSRLRHCLQAGLLCQESLCTVEGIQCLRHEQLWLNYHGEPQANSRELHSMIDQLKRVPAADPLKLYAAVCC